MSFLESARHKPSEFINSKPSLFKELNTPLSKNTIEEANRGLANGTLGSADATKLVWQARDAGQQLFLIKEFPQSSEFSRDQLSSSPFGDSKKPVTAAVQKPFFK